MPIEPEDLRELALAYHELEKKHHAKARRIAVKKAELRRKNQKKILLRRILLSGLVLGAILTTERYTHIHSVDRVGELGAGALADWFFNRAKDVREVLEDEEV